MQQDVSNKQADDDIPVPWTAQQVQAWRAKHPPMSLWSPFIAQCVVAAVLMLAGVALGWPKNVLASMLYGALACLLPAFVGLFGYLRMVRRIERLPVGAAGSMGFAAILGWEGVKIILSIAMLWMAPRRVDSLHWLALLVVFVVTIKAYWLAFLMERIRRREPVQQF